MSDGTKLDRAALDGPGNPTTGGAHREQGAL